MSRFNNLLLAKRLLLSSNYSSNSPFFISWGGVTNELHAELCCIQTNAHNASNIYMATIKKLEKLINPYKRMRAKRNISIKSHEQ